MIRVVVTALGLIAILMITLAAFGLPVGHSLALMAQGAFGDRLAISRTLVKTIPLAIAGMGITVSWRAGMYNIGGEGQFVAGGLMAAILGNVVARGSLGGLIAIPGMLILSIVGGAIWGGLAGWLRAVRGVEIVISTILLNFVALQLLAWAVAGPLQDAGKGVPLSLELPRSAMLPRFDPQNDLHAGLFIAIAVVLATYVFLYWMKGGFVIGLVGAGERVARANRIDTDRVKINAMLISGGLCGLAGGVEYAGISGQLGTSFSQGWGFLAIPVALIGGLHPLWVALSALYFGALFAGSRNLAGFTEQGTTVIYVIQAAAVLGLIALRALPSAKPLPKEAM